MCASDQTGSAKGELLIENDKVKVWREYYDRAELLEAMGLEEDFG